MPDYQYHGRNSLGDKVTGVVNATSAEAVAGQLQEQSIIPTSIRQMAEVRDDDILAKLLPEPKVQMDDLIMMCRQMRALTRSGIPIVQAISGLADITKKRSISRALVDVSNRLSSGSSLANAMGNHPKIFSPMFINMIHVGENTGRLEESFTKLISHIEMERDTRNRMKQAMRYPSFVIIAMVIAMFIINMFVIPQFGKVFEKAGADLPLPTKILMATSNFTVEYWWILLGSAVIGMFSFSSFINTSSGRLWWDRFKMDIPIVGSIFKRIALSRFARTFAMTFESGIPVLNALTIVGPTLGNEYIASNVDRIRNGVERGDSLARSAGAAGIFSDLVIQMIAIGEETGGLDRLLHDVADFYDEEVDYDLKGMSDAIEPIILVMLGGMVLILALGVFLPMWELGSAMQR